MKNYKIALTFFLAALGSNALAAPIIFSGSDSVGPGVASPNADAAYTSWVAALGGATTSLLDFESGDGGAILSGDHDTNSGLRTIESSVLGYNTTVGGDTHFAMWPTFGFTSTSVTWNMAPAINAWGGWFTGLESGISGVVSINYTAGGSVSINVPESSAAGVTFLGFVDAGASISSITLTETAGVGGGRDIWGIDDIETAAASVPEPETLLLLSLSLLGLGLSRRRTRVKQS